MDDFIKNFDNIPDNVKDMLNSFVKNSNNSNSSDSSDSNSFNDFDMDTILKMQKIIKAMNTTESSSRANLLRSLKPYLNPDRQKKVDQYIHQ